MVRGAIADEPHVGPSLAVGAQQLLIPDTDTPFPASKTVRKPVSVACELVVRSLEFCHFLGAK